MRSLAQAILASIVLATVPAGAALAGEPDDRGAEVDLQPTVGAAGADLPDEQVKEFQGSAKIWTSSAAAVAVAPEAVQFVDAITYTLKLDDTGPGAAIGPGVLYVANRLTPPKYPATLTAITFSVSGNGDTHLPRDVDLFVALDSAGSDLGPAGPTTKIVFAATLTLSEATDLNSFLNFPIPTELQPSVYCGDLYLILRDSSSTGNPYFLDTTLPQGRSWISSFNGSTFSKLPSGIVSDGAWLLRGDVDMEREPCSFAKIAGDWSLDTYKGCPAARFSVDAGGHVGACCGLPSATFYGYPCGSNQTCASNTTTQVPSATVNLTTCSFTVVSGNFTWPACARHTWEVIFLDGNTAIRKYTSETRPSGPVICGTTTTCTFQHPMTAHAGYPTPQPVLEPTRAVTLGPNKSDISWTPDPSAATSYRVLRGDLSCAQTATVPSDPVTCLTPAGVAGPPVSDASPLPASGACNASVRGYYYLVQPVSARQKGSLNTCSNFQVQPRNEHPTGACP